MQTDRVQSLCMLEKGQLWKLPEVYIDIVETGERLVHYKLLRNPNQRTVATRLISIGALLSFLTNNEARLVEQLS